ncbi:UNVERIFIED_CONTAM: hypothetical protein Scaly_2217500 [Sesamum calycinum]|uniref:MULE transposase domain-containing protein n=1 Tax=Sesamum calycinum TaxID=2727403 RepID=A0AAW2MAD2_9LAMI
MSKAYDKIEWIFRSGRGIRPGGALSMYLFILLQRHFLGCSKRSSGEATGQAVNFSKSSIVVSGKGHQGVYCFTRYEIEFEQELQGGIVRFGACVREEGGTASRPFVVEEEPRMVLGDYADFFVWLGGVIEWVPTIRDWAQNEGVGVEEGIQEGAVGENESVGVEEGVENEAAGVEEGAEGENESVGVENEAAGTEAVEGEEVGDVTGVFWGDYVDWGEVQGEFQTEGQTGVDVEGLFKGQLLAAIGRDPNDNIYPIAVAYVEVEKYDSWEWFLNLLLRDIGSHNERGWAFISDRQKGLLEAIAELAPGAEHRFCLRHMYNNFKGKFKGQELKKMFWKAASTYNVNQHLKTMAEIQNMYPKRVGEQTPYEWLAEIPPVHWARCFFPTKTRCDVLVNNMNESFNHIIMEARELPIIDMFEWIRKKFMTRIQLVGYPCCHAIAAIDYHRLKMEDFIDECFKKEVYLKVYSHMIHPVPGMHDFEDSKMGRVEPPDNQDQRRQGSSTSHGASGSRRSSTPPLPPFDENETIQSEVPPVFSQPSQDSQAQVPAQPHVPVQPSSSCAKMIHHLKQPQETLLRTAPDETTTRGFNVHKPSYEQAIHSKKTTQQSVQQQHPQSSGLHQQQPKALRKQKKPISLSSKLLKRQQQDAPDQSSQFKRKCCAEKSIHFFTDQRLSQSYKPQQTKKNDGNASGTSNPT